MAELKFDISDTTSGNVVEVLARGADIVELVRESGVKKLSHITEKDWIALGNVGPDGSVHEEWFELGLGHDWIKAQIPEYVKAHAWGRRSNPHPWTKVFA